MPQPVIIALIAFAGALIGGVIQAANQGRLAQGEYLRRQKADAYIKYYEGIARLAHAKNDAEAKLAYSIIAEARARIAMYGSTDVVKKMAAVFRLGPIKRADMAQHAALIKAMRFDASRLPGDVPIEAAFELLYGNAEDFG
jgi:hypothetical protein